ncbi:hypothetical protein [Glutamicibacter sp. NPDC127525]|uniref:hypothetical protein n=1 Tax=unclassified Glutamicibacter TaxID=2627139 RepID=UPI003625B3A0
MTGKTRSFERDPLPVFQASCTCGWKGKEWSFKAPVREEQAAHRCDKAEPLSCEKQG